MSNTMDALRRKRNLSAYEGDPVSVATLTSCVDEASKLLAHTEQWLKKVQLDWMDGKA
jgi:hypothetical protein